VIIKQLQLNILDLFCQRART